MRTITQTSPGFTNLQHRILAVVNAPETAVVGLFFALGLLAAFYLTTHFPVSVENAGFFTQWT